MIRRRRISERIDSDWQQWHLIDVTDREAWADVWVNDRIRHRPAILNLETLSLNVLPIRDAARNGELQNSEFSLLGEYEGKIWLTGDNPGITVIYRRGEKALTVHRGPVPETAPWKQPDAAQALAAGSLSLQSDRGPKLCSLPLPGGRLLVGNAIVREWQEDNLGYDDQSGMSHHIQDLEGGLFIVERSAGTWRKIGAPVEELSDFYVKRVVRDNDRLYVCTNGGVTILSLPDGRIIGRVTVSDGLPSNKVEDVARIGRKLYFACEFGDERGGLAVQDLDSGLIHVLSMSDGLKSNKIKQLRVDGAKLHILYGTFYSPRAYGTVKEDSVAASVADVEKNKSPYQKPDDNVRTFHSSILDTDTGAISDGNEVLPRAFSPSVLDLSLPIIGGMTLYSDREIPVAAQQYPKFIVGTHGLLMIAGLTMLPVLHEALRSKDRVVRSNAARACGAIGDISSITPLMNAMDMESGLVRASIVWALGQLKARESLPKLTELYVDARNDENRRKGSGFRGEQSAAALRSHYDSMRNMDSIGSEWNELKQASSPELIDPKENEWLLSTQIVLEAVRKIGPAASQAFYRTLAGEKDSEGRREAAERLSEGTDSDLEANLPIVRNLLADGDETTRIRAAASLIILGNDAGQAVILEWLRSDVWKKRQAMEQLLRLKDPARRAFAEKDIRAIANDPSLGASDSGSLRNLAKRLLGN
jgi:HEAT repeat protein